MYTQCPKCNNQRTVSVEELRTSGGMLECYICSVTFDALKSLSKGYAPNKKKKTREEVEREDEYLLEQANKEAEGSSIFQSIPWGIASGFCLLLFLFQFYFFEGYNLTQNAKVRPWIEKFCAPVGCQVPRYKNLGELSLMPGTLEPNEGFYLFKTAFTNQAAFSQKIPSIKLTLVDYVGADFAQRVFYPKEFLQQNPELLEPEKTIEVFFKIANPEIKVGGYRFELI